MLNSKLTVCPGGPEGPAGPLGPGGPVYQIKKYMLEASALSEWSWYLTEKVSKTCAQYPLRFMTSLTLVVSAWEI